MVWAWGIAHIVKILEINDLKSFDKQKPCQGEMPVNDRALTVIKKRCEKIWL